MADYFDISLFAGSDKFTMDSFNDMIMQINKLCRTVQTDVSNATQNSISVPIGSIVLWSGSEDTIPGNWQLCDGTNGTPDLRNRFVVGAGSNYSVGDTGGVDTVSLTVSQLPAHSHTVTATAAESGAHAHGMYLKETTDLASGNVRSRYIKETEYVPSSSPTMESAGAHTHDITGTAANTGGGAAHENRPPYYALCYIMRMQ